MAVALVNSRFKECGNDHLKDSYDYTCEKGYSSAIALKVDETIPAMLRKDSHLQRYYWDDDEEAHAAGDGKLETEAVAEVCKNRMKVKLSVTGCSTLECCGHALGMRAGRDMSSRPKARVRVEDGVLVSGIRCNPSWDSDFYSRGKNQETKAGNIRLERHLPALLEYVRANNVDMGPGNDFSGAERCATGGCEGCSGVSCPGLCLIKLRYEDGLESGLGEEVCEAHSGFGFAVRAIAALGFSVFVGGVQVVHEDVRERVKEGGGVRDREGDTHTHTVSEREGRGWWLFQKLLFFINLLLTHPPSAHTFLQVKVHEVPAGPALTAETLKPCRWHKCEWVPGGSTEGGLVKELFYCKGDTLPVAREGDRDRCFIGSMSVPMRSQIWTWRR